MMTEFLHQPPVDKGEIPREGHKEKKNKKKEFQIIIESISLRDISNSSKHLTIYVNMQNQHILISIPPLAFSK